MKDNSFGYIILALIILSGSIFIGLTQKEEIKEYDVVVSINGTDYEAIIYNTNKVIVGYNDCSFDSCFLKTKKYNYSNNNMKVFKDELKKYEFIDYDESITSDFIIYDIKNNKAIYNGDYNLINLVNKIVLGSY